MPLTCHYASPPDGIAEVCKTLSIEAMFLGGGIKTLCALYQYSFSIVGHRRRKPDDGWEGRGTGCGGGVATHLFRDDKTCA